MSRWTIWLPHVACSALQISIAIVRAKGKGRLDVLQQDKIRLVLTTPMEPGGVINEHINKHGDGVKVIALWVDDATKAWEETTARGGKSFLEPTKEEDANGYIIKSGIHTYGETVHIFIERR